MFNIPIIKTRRASLLALLSLAGGTLAAAEPQIVSIKPFVDEFGSGGLVDVQVVAPANSQITLQSRDELGGSEWKDASAPTLVVGSNPITFSVPLTHSDGKTPVPHRFFRFKMESFDVSIEDDGASVSLRTRSEIPSRDRKSVV